MGNERWRPNVTVATIVHQDDSYLLVHESPEGKAVYNQPAGHLDEGESLIEAAERETLEETGWTVSVSAYLGVYRYSAPNGITYLRHGFVADPIKFNPEHRLDNGIIEAVWWGYEKISAHPHLMRSHMVKQLIDDYVANKTYSLELLHESH